MHAMARGEYKSEQNRFLTSPKLISARPNVGSAATSGTQPEANPRIMQGMNAFSHKAGVAMLLMIAAAAPAQAQDRTVFGMQIGARFDLPRCGPGEGSYPARRCYRADPTSGKAWGGHEYRVFLPSAGTPAYVRGELTVAVIDDKVVSVHIPTWGFEAQHGAFTALTKQYGEPTRSGLKAGQNQYRSRYKAQSAEWKFDDFTVTFEGITGSIDWGMIKVSTHRYLKLTEAYEKQQ